MKPVRALAIVLGALLLTWLAQVAVGFWQVGRLEPVLNQENNLTEPPVPSGLAHTGARVFAAEGCLECHSLSVRGPAGSADLTRGWGQRRSVARDYLFREPALVGFARIGPDLSNIGARMPETEKLLQHLYDPRLLKKHSTCPSHPWLFLKRPAGPKTEPDAMKVSESGWQQVVPGYQAKALVSYLQSLNANYPLPEAPLK
ncbi:MAG: cytochrome-c oxidase [Verrucomicrobia bacterium]|nr:cytochrome-c oxidase [Verrucomicrobiota bacterium]